MRVSFDELINDGYLAEDALRFENPSFDTAIIGTDINGRLVYDMDKMIAEFAKTNNCSELEAIEFIEYNTIRALPYYGSMAPIIIYDIDDLYWRLDNV